LEEGSNFDLSGRDTPTYFFYWHRFGDASSLSTYLCERMSNDPSAALALVTAFLPVVISRVGTRAGHLQKDQFDFIASLIDSELVLDSLKKVLPDADLENPNYQSENLEHKKAQKFAEYVVQARTLQTEKQGNQTKND
jgi:hypothetical protein